MQELSYIRCGDYYIPDIRLPKETRPIGRWGRMHRDFIMDVLRHFTPVQSYYKLAKTIEDDPKFDKKRAQRLLRYYVESNQYAIHEKANIMVEHFHTEVIAKGKVGGKIKKQINDIIESVRRDEKYNNAMQFSDKQNARDESDRAAHEAVMNSMQSGLELFREVQNNPSFRKWLFDSAFNSTYQANHNQTSL